MVWSFTNAVQKNKQINSSVYCCCGNLLIWYIFFKYSNYVFAFLHINDLIGYNYIWNNWWNILSLVLNLCCIFLEAIYLLLYYLLCWLFIYTNIIWRISLNIRWPCWWIDPTQIVVPDQYSQICQFISKKLIILILKYTIAWTLERSDP